MNIIVVGNAEWEWSFAWLPAGCPRRRRAPLYVWRVLRERYGTPAREALMARRIRPQTGYPGVP